MRFPKIIKKINTVVGIVCGISVFAIACFTVFEAIARYVFNSPTSWTTNLSTWILIWFAFLGSAYSFQTHGHVVVDMFKDMIDKRTKTRTVRRIMSVIGYAIAVCFVGALLYGGILLTKKAIMYGQVTASLHPIPMVCLTTAIIAGCALMIVTLISIIIDLLGKNDEYL